MENVKAIVTYAKPWEMEDERTGRIRKGVTVEFFVTESLQPVDNDDGSCGYRCSKESLPFECMRKIQSVPGLYSLSFTLQAGPKQRLQTKLSDIEFVSDL